MAKKTKRGVGTKWKQSTAVKGTGKTKTGSEKKARSASKVHAGKKPNNK